MSAPEQPARGSERVICYIVMTAMVLFVMVIPLAPEFHILQLIVPPIVFLVAFARVKGWIRRGSGGGGGP